jgi:tRNA acetyltransferase TAN1
LLKDFNLLATTSRGTERQMCYELRYLLHDLLGDPSPVVDKSGIRGLVVAKTSLNPVEVIEKFRAVLQERPYEFRYALRILPIERVVPTDLDEIKRVAMELAEGIGEHESFRVTVEKRFTSLHSRDFIEAAAADIARKADLETPDKILLIEVLGGVTGMSLIKSDAVLAVVKEKLL